MQLKYTEFVTSNDNKYILSFVYTIPYTQISEHTLYKALMRRNCPSKRNSRHAILDTQIFDFGSMRSKFLSECMNR